VPEEVSQVKVYEFVPDTGVIITLLTIPVMEIVGVAVMASEKPAVMVTTSEAETKLSASVSVKVTVGDVVSKVKVILSVPE
jgi:hypothetical protein